MQSLEVGRYHVVSHCLGRYILSASNMLKAAYSVTSGSYASVHLANDVTACRQVACKTIIMKANERNDPQKVMKEAKILGRLNHVSVCVFFPIVTFEFPKLQPGINRVWDVVMNENGAWL
jgi:serine/threonine protein kinase